ncbi:hypothetical protein [Clostridium butyricum]|uniref:hypothetical protein n=1 Tax=Clostridium butyricum TaxID=1492 RepID=UPI0018A893E7|nr:hypothetical protein [Clostridium butyricum]MDB2140019.1 hypothetical protein [Clostridium butyricum]
MKKEFSRIVFFIDLVFIIFIPTIAKIFTQSGSVLDYIIPYVANMFSLLTVGILIGIYCIVNND